MQVLSVSLAVYVVIGSVASHWRKLLNSDGTDTTFGFLLALLTLLFFLLKYWLSSHSGMPMHIGHSSIIMYSFGRAESDDNYPITNEDVLVYRPI